MSNPIKLYVYTVKDMDASKKLFREFLNVEPYVDSPGYTGFHTGDQEIGLISGTEEKGPIGYIDVNDIKESLKTLLDAGATLKQDIKEVGGGLLVAEVKDPSGNRLGLRQEAK